MACSGVPQTPGLVRALRKPVLGAATARAAAARCLRMMPSCSTPPACRTASEAEEWRSASSADASETSLEAAWKSNTGAGD